MHTRTTHYGPLPPPSSQGFSLATVLIVVLFLALIVWAIVVSRQDRLARQAAIANAAEPAKTNPDEARAMMRQDEMQQREAARVQEAQELALAVQSTVGS